MKSTLLKTLAAASLVATTHAEIQVLGASWKERGVNAPNGTILTNPGTVQATRGYLIFDETIKSATPNKATYIEYGERRGGGEVDRFYTVDTDFTAFVADGISGGSGGRRLYGRMHVPVTIADVTNPMIPFSGTTFSSNMPRKLSFDQTVFQTGASDAVTGPRIVLADASTLRSVISGSANPVKVKAATITDATTELVDRLVKQGYGRDLAEAPTIIDDLDATATLQDGETLTLKVELSPDVFPGPEDDFAAPTYQWFKDDVAILTGVGPTYTVTGGPSEATNGSGNYKVVVTNDFGSATSATIAVSPVTTAIANLPASIALVGASTTTLEAALTPTPITAPTYQWMKSPSGAANSFVSVSAAYGGNDPKLLVIGGETAPVGSVATGVGYYRLDVTTSAGLISSSVCNVTVNSSLGGNFIFSVNLPRKATATLSGVVRLEPTINPGAPTAGVTRKWFKAPLNNPTAFVEIADSNVSFIEVSGNAINEKGPGVYRMTATNTANPPVTITTVDCTVTTAP